MDECPLPPCYLDYMLAVCSDIRDGDRPKVVDSTTEIIGRAIDWWYSNPGLLAAMSIEDALSWQHDGELMSVSHFGGVMDGREISTPYPCSLEWLLFAMRLASCMTERDMMTDILGGMLTELEADQDQDKPQP